MLRYFTAGESHGKFISVILEGIPAGLKITEDDINTELKRRQKGYGRSERMVLESDKVIVTSGIRWGETTGAPICFLIENKISKSYENLMSIYEKDRNEELFVLNPRPGHADLPGYLKYYRRDLRDIQERASARETVGRVAAGAVCRKFILEFNIKIYSFIEQICGINVKQIDIDKIETKIEKIEKSPLRCYDKVAEQKMIKLINKAKNDGDTVGGKFCIIVKNVPPGLGSHTQWDLKLDGRLAQALTSIQAVKGVEFGLGFRFAENFGSSVHDEICYKKGYGFYHKTNNAGGIEGGMSNGEDIIIHAVMKPIPTLRKPLESVNIKTKKVVKANVIRSDVCAVPSCCIIGESVVSIEIAKAFLEKFGGDSIVETRQRYKEYLRYLKSI